MRGIILNDENQLLAQKFRTDEVGGETTYWGTPGGGIDPNESLVECLEREMIEETGIRARVGKLLFIQQFKTPHRSGVIREHMEFFFHIKNHDDYTAIDLSKTSHGLQELTKCEFIDPKNEVLLPAFLQTIDIRNHIENDQPTFIANYMNEIGINE
ncbi:MAG: NUDIX hydrolase [Variovorax sp.]|nr:MAG: NUDIX hydrolase [Variovorax sp.]